MRFSIVLRTQKAADFVLAQVNKVTNKSGADGLGACHFTDEKQ